MSKPRKIRQSKPFDPQIGEIGSWVAWAGIHGQVWALGPARSGQVWIASEDQKFWLAPVAELAAPATWSRAEQFAA